ncbi:MAG: ABC transporter permease [Candidatus Limnocylindrales bacterium]
MTRYIIRRLIGAIPTLFVISVVIYGIVLLSPGGPTARFEQNPKITAAALEAFKHRWGLDQPWFVQYCRWLGVCNPDGQGLGVFISNHGLPNFLPGFLGGGDNGILHLDFGISSTNGTPVMDIIAERFPRTLVLAGTSLVLWMVLAFITGVTAAVKRYTKVDTTITVFNYVAYSFPTFWLGLLLIIIFSAQLGWFPAGGMWDSRNGQIFASQAWWDALFKDPLFTVGDLARHLALPVATLVAVSVAGDSRFIRAAMIDSLRQDFVRTARAKGVSERRVVFRHALRNALLPVVTNIGLELPFLFAGAIATETVFSWPGMGAQFITSIGQYDYPVVMGISVITAVIVVASNLLADIVYAIVDPRISYG